MAWFYGSGSRPIDCPVSKTLDGGLERRRDMGRRLKQELKQREPTNPYHFGTVLLLHDGFRFPPVDEPFRIRITGMSGPLPGHFGTNLGIAISMRMVDAIEALEPGIHNYVPLEVTMPDGSLVAENWFLLNICSRLDTIAVEQSEHIVETWPKPNCNLYFVGSKEGAVAYANRIGDHALWCEYKSGDVIISNDLVNALITAGIFAYYGDRLDYIHPIKEI